MDTTRSGSRLPAVQRLILPATVISAVAAMSIGAYLGFVCWKSGSLQSGMVAIVLILIAPAPVVGASLLGREDAADATEQARRIESTLGFIRMARSIALMAAAYACVLWFCQLGGMMNILALVAFYTSSCATALTFYLPWLSRQETHLRMQLEECRRRIEEFKSGGGAFRA